MHSDRQNQQFSYSQPWSVDHRRVGLGWIVLAAAAGVAIGYIAGSRSEHAKQVSRGDARSDGRNGSDSGDEDTAVLIAKYRQEIVRLSQARNADSAAVRERELTVHELGRRGVDPNSPSVRRLTHEIAELNTAITQADERLARRRDQLAKLTAVRNAEDRQQDGLDTQVEIDARRLVLEHDAGGSHD